MRDCQRCGGEEPWTSHRVSLFGGVKAHLCTKCETEWDRLCRDHPIWADLNRNTARNYHYLALAHAQRPVSEEAWVELGAERDRIESKLHDLGVEFVKPLVGAEAASSAD